MDATDILYTLIELDSLGEYVIPAVKRCIADGADLRRTYYYGIPPLWMAVLSQCSLELVEVLAHASYTPSDLFMYRCDFDITSCYPSRKKNVLVQDEIVADDASDDSDSDWSHHSYEQCNLTLLEFIRYYMKAWRLKRQSSRKFKQYRKILNKIR
jgi:hypothetical protein